MTMLARTKAGSALLQEDVTKSIWRAALAEMERVGYARLSMDNVARRAGVGKAALYRRWTGKEAMLIDILAKGAIVSIPIPNTGSLEGDVSRYITSAMTLLTRAPARRILPDLYAEANRNTRLGNAIRKSIVDRKRQSAGQILERAIERGELSSELDYDAAFAVLMGPIYWELFVTHLAPSRRTEMLIIATLGALRALSEGVESGTRHKLRK
jgi:AcrR family transcriptional regulator